MDKATKKLVYGMVLPLALLSLSVSLFAPHLFAVVILGMISGSTVIIIGMTALIGKLDK